MLNATFSVIFKHCEAFGWNLLQKASKLFDVPEAILALSIGKYPEAASQAF